MSVRGKRIKERKCRVKCIRCGREKLSKIAKPKCPKRFCNGKMVVINLGKEIEQ